MFKLRDNEQVEFIKRNAKKIVELYASTDKYPPSDNPEAIFMAGCPGAGKTEYSKGFKKLIETGSDKRIIHIDADEIKKEIPGYSGKNSEQYQGASSLGVQKILDKVLHRKQDFILDGRFSKHKLAQQNIKRALKHKFKIVIFYIFQDPLIAWEFTKKREALEGRVVPIDTFVDGLFDSIECTELIKQEFSNKVELDIVIKNLANTRIKKSYFNVDGVANYIKIGYNRSSLRKKLL